MKRILLSGVALLLLLPGGMLMAQPSDPPAKEQAQTDEKPAPPKVCILPKVAPAGPDKPADAAKPTQPGGSPAPVPPAPAAVPGGGPAPNPANATALGGTPAGPGVGTSPPPPAPATVAPEPTLPDVVEAVNCSDDKLEITVTSRLYGYKIGYTMPVEIRIITKGKTIIDFDPLKHGKLVLDDHSNKQFELASAPIIVEKAADNGQDDHADDKDKTGGKAKHAGAKKDYNGGKEYDLLLLVRNFVPVPYVTFSMQLPYAVEFAPDGTPLWQVVATPDFVILNYADGVDKMQRPMTDGNTGLVQPRKPWLLPIGVITVTLLFLVWPLLEIIRYVNRVRPRKVMPRDVAAWLAMRRVIKSGKEIGFSDLHYRRLGEVLRKYLSTTYPNLPGMTQSEIEGLPDDAHARLVKSVFAKLDRILIDGERLSQREQQKLLSEVDEIVKRPLTI